MKKKRGNFKMKSIITILVAMLIWVLVSAAEGWFLMTVWNWIASSVASLPPIPSYGVAFAICMLLNMLFK
jgi:hypothetical protein